MEGPDDERDIVKIVSEDGEIIPDDDDADV